MEASPLRKLSQRTYSRRRIGRTSQNSPHSSHSGNAEAVDTKDGGFRETLGVPPGSPEASVAQGEVNGNDTDTSTKRIQLKDSLSTRYYDQYEATTASTAVAAMDALPSTPPHLPRPKPYSSRPDAQPSEKSPAPLSPRTPPRSSKRRMLSRTQSLGTGTPKDERSATKSLIQSPAVSRSTSLEDSSPFALRESLSAGVILPKTPSRCHQPKDPDTPTRAKDSSVADIRTYGSARSHLMTNTNPEVVEGSSSVLHGCTASGSGAGSYRELLQKFDPSERDEDATQQVVYEEAELWRQDPLVRGVPQSLSDLRSLGANRRFMDEVGYLLEPMLEPQARIEVKRSVGLEVLRKMLDDQWLAQLTACAEFEQLWDSFRLALTDCDDLHFKNIVLLFCARAVSAPLMGAEYLAQCTQLTGFAGFLLCMMSSPDAYETEEMSRQDVKMVHELRWAQSKIVDEDIESGLSPLVQARSTHSVATYCVAKLVDVNLLSQKLASENVLRGCRRSVGEILSISADFNAKNLAELGAHLSILLFLNETAEMIHDDEQLGCGLAKLLITVSGVPEDDPNVALQATRCLVSIIRLSAWGVRRSPRWTDNFGTPECISAMLLNIGHCLERIPVAEGLAAGTHSTAKVRSERLAPLEVLSLLLCLLHNILALSTNGLLSMTILTENHVNERQASELPKAPLELLHTARKIQANQSDDTLQNLCRGYAALLLEMISTELISSQIPDLIVALEELRAIQETLVKVAIAGNSVEYPNTSGLLVESVQLSAAIQRLQAAFAHQNALDE